MLCSSQCKGKQLACCQQGCAAPYTASPPPLCVGAQVAFQLFADASTTPPSASLSKYFDDTRVEALIEVYDEKGAATAGPAGRAVETMAAALQDAQSALSAAAAPSAGKADGCLDWTGARLVSPTLCPHFAQTGLVFGTSFHLCACRQLCKPPGIPECCNSWSEAGACSWHCTCGVWSGNSWISAAWRGSQAGRGWHRRQHTLVRWGELGAED